MPCTNRHRQLALPPPIWLGLAALAFISLGLMKAHAAEPAAPAENAINLAGGRYCYNWDFFNNTPQDANDLHLKIKGVQRVSVHYAGPDSYFGQPDATSGYDAGTDTYAVNFSNGVVPQGAKLHVGLCTDHPALAVSEATWTMDGAPIAPAPLYADLRFNHVARDRIRVELTNSQPFTAVLLAFNVLDPQQVLPLDDLNAQGVAQASLLGEVILSPEVLAPGATRTFDVVTQGATQVATAEEGALAEDQPLLVEAILAPLDDEGNTVHVFAQALPPGKQYLPSMMKK